jgi:hypothetical protein
VPVKSGLFIIEIQPVNLQALNFKCLKHVSFCQYVILKGLSFTGENAGPLPTDQHYSYPQYYQTGLHLSIQNYISRRVLFVQ